MRSIFLLLAAALNVHAADWPQWRGPLRNGIVPDSPKLLDAFPAEGLKELWESEEIPTNDEGGLSSPVVADGRVIVGLVWHRDVPSETRQIGELVLRQLGHQSVKSLGKELVEKLETTRESLPPTLRGKKLEEFAQKFAEENFDVKQRQLYTGWLTKRFTKGKLALPLACSETLDEQQGSRLCQRSGDEGVAGCAGMERRGEARDRRRGAADEARRGRCGDVPGL